MGHVLLVVVDPTDFKADLYLPAGQLARIRLHQVVQAASVSGSPVANAAGIAPGPTPRPVSRAAMPLTGRATWISPILDARRGQGRARTLSAQAGRTHQPGTLVRVRLQGE